MAREETKKILLVRIAEGLQKTVEEGVWENRGGGFVNCINGTYFNVNDAFKALAEAEADILNLLLTPSEAGTEEIIIGG